MKKRISIEEVTSGKDKYVIGGESKKKNENILESVYDIIFEELDKKTYKETKVFLEKFKIEDIDEINDLDINVIKEICLYLGLENKDVKEFIENGSSNISEKTTNDENVVQLGENEENTNDERDEEDEGDENNGNNEGSESEEELINSINDKIEIMRKKDPNYLKVKSGFVAPPGIYEFEIIGLSEFQQQNPFKDNILQDKIKIEFAVSDEKSRNKYKINWYGLKSMNVKSNLYQLYIKLVGVPGEDNYEIDLKNDLLGVKGKAKVINKMNNLKKQKAYIDTIIESYKKGR